ncbi:EF hand family protein [Trichomonas vaginalis G3]|uniref:EF hand family protein n=1 Tax=Trichomonas vaginalis (strain ATCC PRA-98 / G3) TaxID=412133 RepID=A2EMU5_TRIV3|nr:protein serine/threonine kinase protein [Trichomonas vaginalis G3]EAY06018.1 EF hand family protein [Trichomonas vaginalis G3]KAI5512809.1 protein serine/threonine kinase protein [Trichomonas vaginalis G3]|eukprot:XP_001318241.1 EF hand family protein [Trichomonas vaginalis G3]
MSVEPLYEEIRQRIIERGAIGIRGIGRLFGIADDDGNKKIDIREEFPKLIHDIGLKYNKDQIAALSKDLDRDGSGAIDYEEFLFRLAKPMSQARIDMVVKAFESIDKDNNGYVDIKDLQAVHNKEKSEAVRVGKVSAAEVFKNLCANYDNGDGKITKDEFINYYRQISPSIDNDEHFILLIKNAWKLE